MNIHIYSLLEKINLFHKHYDIKALNNSFMGGGGYYKHFDFLIF